MACLAFELRQTMLGHLCLCASLVLVSKAVMADSRTPMRLEHDVRFSIDAPYQDRGGVQYSYLLLEDRPSPETHPVFRVFRALDRRDVWRTLDEPSHVVLSRLVYTVDRDVTFFTEARATDVNYINAVAKGMNVERRPDGTFRVRTMPENTVSIAVYDAARLAADPAAKAIVAQVLAATKVEATPEVVVAQENRDFARVLGMRTAEGSFTWTMHFSLGPGRTRLMVYTMTYLRNLPPFFLGGAARVRRESVDGARALIEQLRAYEGT